MTVTAADTAGAVTVAPPSVTFTAANWDTAQTVTVTAADDDDSVNAAAQITHTVAGYGTVTAADVAVTVTDDDLDPSVIPIVHSPDRPNAPIIGTVECTTAVTVEWDAVTAGAPVAGYRVRISVYGSVRETLEVDTTATSATVALTDADGASVVVASLAAFNHDPVTDDVQLSNWDLEYVPC